MNQDAHRRCYSALFVFFILFLVLFQTSSAQLTTVKVTPPTVAATVGTDFAINITVGSVLDLYGWEFRISWNSTLLDITSVVEGPFLETGGSTFFSYNVNATIGHMVVDCTLLGIIPGVSGSGTLATITFHVKTIGECPLDLYSVLLANSFEQSIFCTILDGYGYFTSMHDVAVTDVNVAPLCALPGNPIIINVTVQNQGISNEIFNITTYVDTQVIGIQAISLNSGSSTVVSFTWDTTGFEHGDYTISASASNVSEEVDTADNSKTADDIATILYPGHDTAVIGMKLSKTIVGQGYCVYVNVTAKNYGIFSETFVTTTYANTTAIESKTTVLQSGNSGVLTFTWNTTGFAKGNYSINAYAWPVQDETDFDDNSLFDGSAIISIVGDITGSDGWPDGQVDMKDISKVAKLFGVNYPSPRYDANCDVIYDLGIDMKDISTVAKRFGKTE